MGKTAKVDVTVQNTSSCSSKTCLCANGWRGTGCNDGKSNNILHSNYTFKYLFTPN